MTTSMCFGNYAVLAEDNVTVTVNGNKLNFDQPPIIKDGRTPVPLRAIFEALGAEVLRLEDEQAVAAQSGDTTIVMKIGKNQFGKMTSSDDGVLYNLDVPPAIINGRTLVPARAVAEALDCSVNWDGSTQTVTISSEKWIRGANSPTNAYIHNGVVYYSFIYQCNNKFKNAEKCKTPNLTAEDIRNAFIKAYNIAMADRTTVLEDCKIMIDTVCNCTKLNEEIDALTAELKVVSELVSECVNENARKKQSQDAYTKKYNSLVRRYERAEKRLNKAIAEREDKVNKECELRLFFETLENKPQLIDTWDENLWITLVEKMEVSHDKMCTVFFKNGVSVNVVL